MQFEFDAQFNKREYIEFSHLCLSKKKYKHPTIRYWAVNLLVFVLSIPMFFLGNDTFALWMIVFSAVFFLLNLYMIVIGPRQAWKKIAPMQKITTHYTLDEGSIHVVSTGTGFNNSSELSYDQLISVTETDLAFHVYIAKNQAFLIPKRCLKSEEIPLLGALLREKVGVQKYTSII